MAHHESKCWLRKFTFDDAPFLLEMVNDPAWLRFIGDRNVGNLQQARDFIQRGPLQSYEEHGFGMYVFGVEKHPAGMVGLLQREQLSKPDLGYAILPKYRGKGLTFEACRAMLDIEYQRAGIDNVYAIVSPDNVASIGLLAKLGFADRGLIEHEGDRVRLLELASVHSH